MTILFVFWLILSLVAERGHAFTSTSWTVSSKSTCQRESAGNVVLRSSQDLSGNGGVIKNVLIEGSGDFYPEGTAIATSYVGTLAEANWNANEVVSCWLSEQQGLPDHVAEKMVEKQVDESKLTNTDTFFTPDFVAEELGLKGSAIACKKLVMAAKRLATTRREHPAGTVFDQNDNYQITIGTSKLIRGMELGVKSMRPGEKAQLVIRSDYAYGKDGYRKANGEVLVPPFATLSFEMKLL